MPRPRVSDKFPSVIAGQPSVHVDFHVRVEVVRFLPRFCVLRLVPPAGLGYVGYRRPHGTY